VNDVAPSAAPASPAGDRKLSDDASVQAFLRMACDWPGAGFLLEKGVISWTNRIFASGVGSDPEALVGRNIAEVYPMKRSERFPAGHVRTAGGVVLLPRLAYSDSAGTARSAAGMVIPLSTSGDDVVGALFTRTESDVYLQSRLHDLLVGTPISLAVTDEECRFIWTAGSLPQAACAAIGVSSLSDLVGRRAHELCPSENRDGRVAAQFDAAVNGQHSYSPFPLFGGSAQCWVGPLVNGSGDVVGTLLAMTDITELEQARMGQRLAERAYRAVVDYTNLPVAEVDLTGTITDANLACSELLGIPLSTLRGLHWSRVSSRSDSVLVPTIVQLVEGRRQRVDFRSGVRHADGTEILVNVTIAPVHGANGSVRSTIAIVRPLEQHGRNPRITLTERESEVLLHLASGRSVAEIAKLTCLTRRGVDYNISRLRHKLRDSDHTPLTTPALISRAHACGVLLPTWPPSLNRW
jgi:PAS domain S-box-containing protein